MSKVTIGDGTKASFWDSLWLGGIIPKHIAPLIFKISKKKKWSIWEAITREAWILDIDFSEGLSVNHLEEFKKLWQLTSQLQLDDEVSDAITWKLTSSGVYSCSSANKAQFFGEIDSLMNNLVW